MRATDPVVPCRRGGRVAWRARWRVAARGRPAGGGRLVPGLRRVVRRLCGAGAGGGRLALGDAGDDAGLPGAGVVDGDTVTWAAPGRGTLRARIVGYDTPELFSPRCAAEPEAAARARQVLATWVWHATSTEVAFLGHDRYGRTLVDMRLTGSGCRRAWSRGGNGAALLRAAARRLVRLRRGAMFRPRADRQPRRDRLPGHPHRAAAGGRARSRSIRTPTPRRCTCAMADEAVQIGPAPARGELSRRREDHRGGARRPAPRRSIRATASCRENADFAEAVIGGRAGLGRAAGRRRSAPWG